VPSNIPVTSSSRPLASQLAARPAHKAESFRARGADKLGREGGKGSRPMLSAPNSTSTARGRPIAPNGVHADGASARFRKIVGHVEKTCARRSAQRIREASAPRASLGQGRRRSGPQTKRAIDVQPRVAPRARSRRCSAEHGRRSRRAGRTPPAVDVPPPGHKTMTGPVDRSSSAAQGAALDQTAPARRHRQKHIACFGRTQEGRSALIDGCRGARVPHEDAPPEEPERGPAVPRPSAPLRERDCAPPRRDPRNWPPWPLFTSAPAGFLLGQAQKFDDPNPDWWNSKAVAAGAPAAGPRVLIPDGTSTNRLRTGRGKGSAGEPIQRSAVPNIAVNPGFAAADELRQKPRFAERTFTRQLAHCRREGGTRRPRWRKAANSTRGQ